MFPTYRVLIAIHSLARTPLIARALVRDQICVPQGSLLRCGKARISIPRICPMRIQYTGEAKRFQIELLAWHKASRAQNACSNQKPNGGNQPYELLRRNSQASNASSSHSFLGPKK